MTFPELVDELFDLARIFFWIGIGLCGLIAAALALFALGSAMAGGAS